MNKKLENKQIKNYDAKKRKIQKKEILNTLSKKEKTEKQIKRQF